jgi:hypothetical protein
LTSRRCSPAAQANTANRLAAITAERRGDGGAGEGGRTKGSGTTRPRRAPRGRNWTSGGGTTMFGARTSRAREDDVHGPPHHGARQRPRRRRERVHQPHPVEPGDPGARRGTDERAFDSTGRTSLRYKVTRALCRVRCR